MVSKDHSDRLCYFEIEDLNVNLPAKIADITQILDGMPGVRIQLQARLIDDKAEVQYVSHLKGVQIIGHLPSSMKVSLTRAEVSKTQSGLQGIKVSELRFFWG